jgi:hypothetical protein
MKTRALVLTIVLTSVTTVQAAEPPKPAPPAIKVATFDVDATPPVGSAMAYDPVKRHDELTLRCRGIVIIGAGKPIVLSRWTGSG